MKRPAAKPVVAADNSDSDAGPDDEDGILKGEELLRDRLVSRKFDDIFDTLPDHVQSAYTEAFIDINPITVSWLVYQHIGLNANV